MLARGLCRLAADVPKTSTHDLSRLALLQTRLGSQNGLVKPVTRVISRVFKVGFSVNRRHFATARATKPTTKVVKDVKKAVAKKPAAKKPAKKAAKKPAAKKKTKKAVKKPAKKPKKPAKVLTEEEKSANQIQELKKIALKGSPPRGTRLSAYNVFLREHTKGTSGVASSKVKEAAAKYKALSAAEREVRTQLSHAKGH
jgi:outer membrane biosynthesis protein TonB